MARKTRVETGGRQKACPEHNLISSLGGVNKLLSQLQTIHCCADLKGERKHPHCGFK